MSQSQGTLKTRPISELLNMKMLRAVPRGGVLRDRRRRDRFSCRIPAVLVWDGRECPLECVDVSAEGLRLTTHRPLMLRPGQLVHIRIRVNDQLFEDDYLVARPPRLETSSITIHLKLVAAEPLPA